MPPSCRFSVILPDDRGLGTAENVFRRAIEEPIEMLGLVDDGLRRFLAAR